MPQLTDQKYIRALLSRHNFTFSKGLGQNFLINPEVCPAMAELSGAKAGVGVIEIGPGIGVLTAELAARAEKVVCVELDERLFPVLGETLAGHDNVTLIHGDALKLDLGHIIGMHLAGLEVILCANLPYYITSPILMRILESRLRIGSITVMVQKEAAERICAAPGSKEAGAISAAVWYYAEPEILFAVGKTSFLPAPKVDSSVIKLTVRQKPAVDPVDEAHFFSVIKAGFSQRRKTLHNSLSSGLGVAKDELSLIFAAANLSPKARAEELTLSDFCRLSDTMVQKKY